MVAKGRRMTPNSKFQKHNLLIIKYAFWGVVVAHKTLKILIDIKNGVIFA
jgi:hypothetical protein